MRVFAVVPAYNADWCLGACIVGLKGAGFAPGEIVVVDDGSTDGTAQVAGKAGVLLVQGPANSGAAAARNLGAEAAAAAGAEILFFVDSDVVVHPNARQQVIDRFTDEPGIAAMFGAYDDSPGCQNLVSQYRNLLHHHVHMKGPREPTIFWTGCGAVRQQAFVRVGGFDAGLRMMEDVEFGHRLANSGGRIRLDPALQGKHLKCWSLRNMIHMDIFDRAIPWSRLMLFDGGIESEFNLSASHRLSAITVLFILASLLMAFLWPAALWSALGLTLGFVALNFALFQLIRRRVGFFGMMGSVPLHMIHYGCAMIGLGSVVLVEWLPSRLVGETRAKPAG